MLDRRDTRGLVRLVWACAALCFGSMAACDDSAKDGTAIKEGVSAATQNAPTSQTPQSPKVRQPQTAGPQHEANPKPSMAGFAKARSLLDVPVHIQENAIRGNRRLARLRPGTPIRWTPDAKPAAGERSAIDEGFPIYALVTNYQGVRGVERDPLWLATTYRGIRLVYYVDLKDVPHVVNKPSKLFFEASKVPRPGGPIQHASEEEKSAPVAMVTVASGTPLTVIEETKAYVKARVEHPGVAMEGYFEVKDVGRTFILGIEPLEKPRLNAELAVDSEATDLTVSAESEKAVSEATQAKLSIPVLDAPDGQPIATLTSNEHTFVEADKEVVKGFRRIVVHTTPISQFPAVAGPVISGWIRERQLKDTHSRELAAWPVKQEVMPEAGTHGSASEKKRDLELETLFLSELNGEVVGAVVSDASAAPVGGPDFVMVNNGFGGTFKLVVTSMQAQERRLSQHKQRRALDEGSEEGTGPPGKGAGPGRGTGSGKGMGPGRGMGPGKGMGPGNGN